MQPNQAHTHARTHARTHGHAHGVSVRVPSCVHTCVIHAMHGLSPAVSQTYVRIEGFPHEALEDDAVVVGDDRLVVLPVCEYFRHVAVPQVESEDDNNVQNHRHQRQDVAGAVGVEQRALRAEQGERLDVKRVLAVCGPARAVLAWLDVALQVEAANHYGESADQKHARDGCRHQVSASRPFGSVGSVRFGSVRVRSVVAFRDIPVAGNARMHVQYRHGLRCGAASSQASNQPAVTRNMPSHNEGRPNATQPTNQPARLKQARCRRTQSLSVEIQHACHSCVDTTSNNQQTNLPKRRVGEKYFSRWPVTGDVRMVPSNSGLMSTLCVSACKRLSTYVPHCHEMRASCCS